MGWKTLCDLIPPEMGPSTVCLQFAFQLQTWTWILLWPESYLISFSANFVERILHSHLTLQKGKILEVGQFKDTCLILNKTNGIAANPKLIDLGTYLSQVHLSVPCTNAFFLGIVGELVGGVCTPNQLGAFPIHIISHTIFPPSWPLILMVNITEQPCEYCILTSICHSGHTNAQSPLSHPLLMWIRLYLLLKIISVQPLDSM